jgi:hypothetical protein
MLVFSLSLGWQRQKHYPPGQPTLPYLVVASGNLNMTTPLHIAVRNGHAGVIRQLAEAKADIDARNQVRSQHDKT